ncbi:MAG: DUF2959 family protein, partial [Bdellovibrionales bacterium]|nr:DUF2959 family protein [Bdellovibrionales bacterium]
SQRQLDETKDKYTKMLAAMKRAESKIPPVLTVFNDQVLFLKHNLNASALSSIDGVRDEIAGEISNLVDEIERATQESERFVSELG